MTKRRQEGYLLPLVIDPPGRRCVCVPIPDDENHILAFLGQLDELAYWWNWERDDLKRGTQAARVWREIVECVRSNVNNNCGCGGTPALQRYNDRGILETSDDGGQTWQENRPIDPRFNSPQLPPPIGGTVDENKCRAVTNAKDNIKSAAENTSNQLALSSQVSGLISVLTALLIFAGIIGTGGAATPLVLALVAALVGVTQAAFDAAMTLAVYDELLCILYCRIGEDATYSEIAWQSVKSDIAAAFGGIAEKFLYDYVNAIGPVGLNNLASSTTASVADCMGCQCESCQFFTNSVQLNWGLWTVGSETRYPADFTVTPVLTFIPSPPQFAANGYGSSPNEFIRANHVFAEACRIYQISVSTPGESQAVRVSASIKSGGVWVDVGNQVFANHNGGVPWSFVVSPRLLATEVQIQMFGFAPRILSIAVV